MRVLIVKTHHRWATYYIPACAYRRATGDSEGFNLIGLSKGFAQIPSRHSAVDRVIPVAIRRWRKAQFSAPIKSGTHESPFIEAVCARAAIRRCVIDARGLVNAALVTRLAHAG